MFLKQFKDFARSLRFRIALSYFVLVVLSSMVLFGFLYYLLDESLQEKDRRIIISDFKKFSILANVSGADALSAWFGSNQNTSQSLDVFVRLQDASGKIIFQHLPAVMKEISQTDFDQRSSLVKEGVVARVESPQDSEDAIEFYSDHLASGLKLQVGKDTEDREELLGRFREAFSLVIGITLLTALITAFLFSSKVLRPIQKLIFTVEDVRRGNLSARAVVEESGDEMNALAKFLNGMLEQNSKLIAALTESLDAVAHDLRTPLTRLRVHAERALQSNGPDSSIIIRQHQETFGLILESTDQVIQLLDAILDVSESKAGTLALRYSTMSLRQMLLDVIDVYSIIAEDNKIALVTGEIEDTEFDADIRIKQVVANLIDNAIKFSPTGSCIGISAKTTDRGIVIAVEDEGPGISRRDEVKIWDRLYRGDASRTTRGMGLGLSLVRSIVLVHGGSVSVKPARDHVAFPGSRFEISLPLARKELGLPS